MRECRQDCAWLVRRRGSEACAAALLAAGGAPATMRVALDEGAVMPSRSHPTDAGLDLAAPAPLTLPPFSRLTVSTGVRVELPPGTVGLVCGRSGLGRDGVTAAGVVDEGYSGPVMVTLINHGSASHEFARGDRLAQLLVLPDARPEPVGAPSVAAGERGGAGLGSTGR